MTLAVLVSGWAHVLHAVYKPWGQGTVLYMLQHGSLFVTSFVFLMGLLFKVDGVDSASPAYSSLSQLMLAMCTIFLIVWLAVVCRCVLNNLRRANEGKSATHSGSSRALPLAGTASGSEGAYAGGRQLEPPGFSEERRRVPVAEEFEVGRYASDLEGHDFGGNSSTGDVVSGRIAATAFGSSGISQMRPDAKDEPDGSDERTASSGTFVTAGAEGIKAVPAVASASARLTDAARKLSPLQVVSAVSGGRSQGALHGVSTGRSVRTREQNWKSIAAAKTLRLASLTALQRQKQARSTADEIGRSASRMTGSASLPISFGEDAILIVSNPLLVRRQ